MSVTGSDILLGLVFSPLSPFEGTISTRKNSFLSCLTNIVDTGRMSLAPEVVILFKIKVN